MTLASLNDTIAALATAPGRGAVAVVRVSGPRSLELLEALCPAETELPPERCQVLRAIRNPESGDAVDRALVTLFRAPRSYTGEDTVEFSTHGGDLTPQLLLDALYAAGARPALPGEFTRRAVLNGKLDLLQAEAVADLIDGRSPALHRAALRQMERGLSSRIGHLRDAVLRTEALIGYGIDFPDEDEPPVPYAVIEAAAAQTIEQLDAILRTSPQGEMLRSGALVVLAGYPNSGKSSLFNALLGAERSIVTSIPGTTRDAVEADITLDGYPFRLVDTAGLRETEDSVEAMGVEVARRYLAAADIILFCSEAARGLDATEIAFLERPRDATVLLVRTKSDLAGEIESVAEPISVGAMVSVRSGTGLDAVREGLVGAAFGMIRTEPSDSPIVTNRRHRRSLEVARSETASFLEGIATGLPPEIAATHLRSAAHALEQLIGTVTTDDVLGEIFGRFCVGK